MITIQREMLFQAAMDVDELLEQHYQELCLNKDRVKLNPMWDRYRDLESIGALAVFTARDGEALVGYSAFFIQNHIHYADLKVAQNDVLFLTPPQRRGRTGLRLVQFCEQELQKLGVHKIVWRAKPDTALIPILNRMGYRTEEVSLGKMLGA